MSAQRRLDVIASFEGEARSDGSASIGDFHALCAQHRPPEGADLVAGERVGQNSRIQPIVIPATIDLGTWQQSALP
jgi:hypothetical protein